MTSDLDNDTKRSMVDATKTQIELLAYKTQLERELKDVVKLMPDTLAVQSVRTILAYWMQTANGKDPLETANRFSCMAKQLDLIREDLNKRARELDELHLRFRLQAGRGILQNLLGEKRSYIPEPEQLDR